MAIPSESGGETATLADIVTWFNDYLGRSPAWEEWVGRVGQDRLAMFAQIRCSQEAMNLRQAHGAEPDLWCATHDPGTGAPVVQPQPPPPPPPPPGGGANTGGTTAQDIWFQILSKIIDVLTTLGHIKDDVTQQVQQKLNDAIPEIAKAVQKVQGQLGNLASGLIPSTLSLVGAALGGVENILGTFLSNAADIGDIGDFAVDVFRQNATPMGNFLFDVLGGGIAEGIKKVVLENETGETETGQLMMEATGIPKELWGRPWDILTEMENRFGSGNFMGKLALWAMSTFQVPGAVLKPMLDLVEQENRAILPFVPQSPADLANLVIREYLTEEQAAGIALRWGFSNATFAQSIELAKRPPAIEEGVQALNRGIIDDETLDLIFRRSSLPREYYDMAKKLALQLPPIQDTIRMAVREVFTPDLRQALTLDAEYPEALTPKARALNLAESDARDYWAAHWQLPSLDNLFDMLHRGEITLEETQQAIKANDYAPAWRDKLIALSYNLFTRVDIRRIHKQLKKDHAWLVEAHKKLGYAPADAETMAEFVEKLNSEDKAVKLKDLTDGLRSMVLNGIVAATYSEEEGRSYLAALGYDDAEITDYINYSRAIREDKIRARIVERLGDLFVKNLATDAEVTAYMAGRGFTQEEINLRLEEWKYEKELKGPSEAQLKEKDLTKAELIAAYKDGISNRSETEKDLLAMRYDNVEVKALLDMADFDKAKVVQKEEIEVIHNDVLRQKIGEQEAITKLDALGVRPSQRNSLIGAWMRAVESKSFDMPISMVKDLFTAGIRTEDVTRESLSRIGASDDDARDIMALWGSKKAAAEARAAKTTAKAGG